MNPIRGLFRAKTHHTPTGSETPAPPSPGHEAKNGRSIGSALSHLLPRGRKHSAATPQASLPPRRPLPGPTSAGRRSLVELMHDERPTGLTKQYIKFGAEAEVLGERGNVAAKRHDGGPKVAEVSPEVVQAQQDRLKQVKLAANQLDELVRNASRGTFDRQIAKGIVPKQALEGTQGLTKEDFLDVIIQFQNVQSNRHDVLVAKAAKDLEKLLPDATEQQAEQFLQGLMHRPSAVSAGKQESGAIEPEETAKQALRQAMADLPERRRGDLVDTYLQNLENSRRLTGE